MSLKGTAVLLVAGHMTLSIDGRTVAPYWRKPNAWTDILYPVLEYHVLPGRHTFVARAEWIPVEVGAVVVDLIPTPEGMPRKTRMSLMGAYPFLGGELCLGSRWPKWFPMTIWPMPSLHALIGTDTVPVADALYGKGASVSCDLQAGWIYKIEACWVHADGSPSHQYALDKEVLIRPGALSDPETSGAKLDVIRWYPVELFASETLSMAMPWVRHMPRNWREFFYKEMTYNTADMHKLVQQDVLGRHIRMLPIPFSLRSLPILFSFPFDGGKALKTSLDKADEWHKRESAKFHSRISEEYKGEIGRDINKGVVCDRARELNEAVGHFDKALSIRQDPLAYLNRGTVRWRLGERQAALQDWLLAKRLSTWPCLARPVEERIRKARGAGVRVNRSASADEQRK
ncbi:MAG TPA: hypothetical protein VNE39_22960 [Planctomycetota bacterium]|nr:hypothetical protein [Planctomycetota bacterium]